MHTVEHIFEHELERFIASVSRAKQCKIDKSHVWIADPFNTRPLRCMARKYDLYRHMKGNINKQCSNKASIGDFCYQCIKRKLWLGRIDEIPSRQVIQKYQKFASTNYGVRHSILKDIDTTNSKKFWCSKPRTASRRYSSSKATPSPLMLSHTEEPHYFDANLSLSTEEQLGRTFSDHASRVCLVYTNVLNPTVEDASIPISFLGISRPFSARDMDDFPDNLDAHLELQVQSHMDVPRYKLHQVLDTEWKDHNEFVHWYAEHRLDLKDEAHEVEWKFSILYDTYILDHDKRIVGFCRDWIDELNELPPTKKTDNDIVFHDDDQQTIVEYVLEPYIDPEDYEDQQCVDMEELASSKYCHGLRAGIYREFKYDPEYNVFENQCYFEEQPKEVLYTSTQRKKAVYIYSKQELENMKQEYQ